MICPLFNAILINSKFINIFEFKSTIFEIIEKYNENLRIDKEIQSAKDTVFWELCSKIAGKLTSSLDLTFT